MTAAAYLRFDEAFEFSMLNEFIQHFGLTPSNGGWITSTPHDLITLSIVGAQTTPGAGTLELEELKIVGESDHRATLTLIAELATWLWVRTNSWLTGDAEIVHRVAVGVRVPS